MNHGLTPIKRKKTDYSFHRTYGGISPSVFPAEFIIDSGLTMPDQNADGLFEACTAYAQLELCTDQDGIVYNSYRDLYEKTLALENAPFGAGCDIRDSLKNVVIYYKRGAYYAVESSKFDWFDSIRSVILTNFQSNNVRCAVSIGTPWFPEWRIGPSGIIPQVFTGDVSKLAWHNWAIKGWKRIDGVPYLLGKTWQGKNYGDKGWAYYPREAINAVMKVRGTGAFTVAPYDPTKVQNVKKTIIEALLHFLQQLLTLTPAPMASINTESMTLYTTALNLKGQYLTLDSTVPKGFNCAETVSYLLKKCGYDMPEKGYAGTIALNGWLEKNCDEVSAVTVGDIIISVTKGANHGHVGIQGYQAILSNDSQTGTLESYWSLQAWLLFYEKQKGLVTKFYRLR